MTQINLELPCHPQILLPHMPFWELFRELKLKKSWTVIHNNSFYDYGFIDYVKYLFIYIFSFAYNYTNKQHVYPNISVQPQNAQTSNEYSLRM